MKTERALIERLKTRANLTYDSTLHHCTASRDVVYEDHLGLTVDTERDVENIPEWERQLIWASKVDRNKLYGFQHAIFHGQELIRKLEQWALQEYETEYVHPPNPL
ncbi:MAG: hypothetical protein R3C11_24890 [Planctomycetaceae bacterium]